MFKRIQILIIAAFLLFLPARAIEEITQGQVLSIEDCVSAALANSPQIKMYENKMQSNIKQMPER